MSGGGVFPRLLPEAVLFFTAIFVLLADIGYRRQRPRLVFWIAFAGLAVAATHALLTLGQESVSLLSGSIAIDPVSQFFKVLLIVAAAVVALMAWLSKEVPDDEQSEMQALLLLSTLGMCVLVSANHLLLLFLSYEMVGFGSYVLAAFRRRSSVSSEAGMKLFIHGGMTAVLLAFGIAILYGVSGSFDVHAIRESLVAAGAGKPVIHLWLAFGLIFVAIAGTMAVFPFHFTVMDAVQGSPTPVSAFLSVGPVIASVALALRICLQLFSVRDGAGWTPLSGLEWPAFVAGIAAATMTVGNLTALFQRNLKRALGFACTAQTGFLMMGLAVSTVPGITSVLFSLVAYLVAVLGAFFVVQWVADRCGSEDVGVLTGLVRRSPFQGVALCLFFLGIAGIPPLSGFVARFYVLGTVIQEKLYWLAILAAANWVIGLSYFLFMIRQMFAAPAEERAGLEREPAGLAIHAAVACLTVPVLLLGVWWDPLVNYISRSLRTVGW